MFRQMWRKTKCEYSLGIRGWGEEGWIRINGKKKCRENEEEWQKKE